MQDSLGGAVNFIAIKRDVTEPTAAGDAKPVHAAIMESSADAIVAYTPAGAIVSWNSGAERVYGYSAAEVIGRYVSTLVLPERQPGLAYITEQVLQGSAVSQREDLHRRRDGRSFETSVTARAVRDSSGGVAAISAIIRDISERKKAERAQALLAAIVEASTCSTPWMTSCGLRRSRRRQRGLLGRKRQRAARRRRWSPAAARACAHPPPGSASSAAPAIRADAQKQPALRGRQQIFGVQSVFRAIRRTQVHA